jgi:hypothetical protein
MHASLNQRCAHTIDEVPTCPLESMELDFNSRTHDNRARLLPLPNRFPLPRSAPRRSVLKLSSL